MYGQSFLIACPFEETVRWDNNRENKSIIDWGAVWQNGVLLFTEARKWELRGDSASDLLRIAT